MDDNDQYFDAVDEANPMVRCSTCGHEVPEANMSLHSARCGGGRSSRSSQAAHNADRSDGGDEDEGAPGVDDTNVSDSSGESNANAEEAAATDNADASVAPDLEGGGASGEAARRECCICMVEIETDEGPIGCAGTETHYWHTECGLRYVRLAVAAGGAFEGVRTQPQSLVGDQHEHQPLTSAAGELPCPSFVLGCDSAALPIDTICRMLGNSRDASEEFMMAFRNVNIREATANQQTATNNDDEEAARNELPVADQIFHRVTDALSRGYQMTCPSCRQRGTKDSECSHIHCPTCGSDWCYCCGRFRLESGPTNARCRGCDATAIYIERQPGWDSFALLGTSENAKTGALWEFHRRVQAYYVRGIKEVTPADQWEAFVEAYPTVLQNTPTFGRHILWDDLDSASPPVFGNSVENDLLWKLQPVPQQQRQAQQQQQQQQPPPPPPGDIDSLWDVFRTFEGKIWRGALFFSVFVLILKWIINSPGVAVLADTTVAATSFVGVSYALLWCTDFFASHPNHAVRRTFPEAFFVGKQNQQPFLSSFGRFRNSRREHVCFWIGSIALGSLFIGISNEYGSILVLRIIGTSVLTFGLSCAALELAVGNKSPPPDLENDSLCDAYRSLSLLSAVFVLSLALGAGLMTGQSYKIRISGVFLLSASLGALAAEYVPRLFRGATTIWMPLEAETRKMSYIFFLSVSIGSSLIWLGHFFFGAFVTGILVLICGVIYAWYLRCAQTD